MEQAAKKGNAFISGVDSVKGFSEALSLVNNENQLEAIAEKEDKK